MEDLAKLTEKISKLKGEIEEELSKRFRALKGEEYFVVGMKGDICKVTEENTKFDNYNYETGNYFRSEEEAKQKIKHLKIETKLKDLALKLNNGNFVDWNNTSQTKFSIVYDYSEDPYERNKKVGLRLRSYNYYKKADIYCLNSSFLEEAKREIGEEELEEFYKNY